MEFQTLIFDLDGTISDPFEGISRSVNYALETLGYEIVDPERIRPMIGPPLTEIFEYLLGSLADSRMLELVASYRDRYAATGYAENVIYEGIPETIESLSVHGYTMGICTSKRADYAASIIEMFGLQRFFTFVDGGDVHIKKSMQLECLVANGIDASTTVMIGDRAVDILAAKSNNMKSVGVSWGFGGDDELSNAGADFLLRSPTELLELFIC